MIDPDDLAVETSEALSFKTVLSLPLVHFTKSYQSMQYTNKSL